MYIYKITNDINDKIYVGQTIRPIEERFHRHIQEALSNKLDTHFARAIREYGPEHFFVTCIDTASSKEELNQKEIYWIKYYNSFEEGYNSTFGGEGGNTYCKKSQKEMDNIKEKIRETKIGGKNPNARKIKCKNVKTGEELLFDSAADVQRYFNHGNHNFVTRRCNHAVRCLWQGEWSIAYAEDDYDEKVTKEKNNRKSTHIKLIDLQTNKEYEFPSYASAERYFNLPKKSISSKAYLKGEEFIHLNRYKITVLN